MLSGPSRPHLTVPPRHTLRGSKTGPPRACESAGLGVLAPRAASPANLVTQGGDFAAQAGQLRRARACSRARTPRSSCATVWYPTHHPLM